MHEFRGIRYIQQNGRECALLNKDCKLPRGGGFLSILLFFFLDMVLYNFTIDHLLGSNKKHFNNNNKNNNNSINNNIILLCVRCQQLVD